MSRVFPVFSCELGDAKGGLAGWEILRYGSIKKREKGGDHGPRGISRAAVPEHVCPLLRYAQYALEGDALLAEEAVQEAFATAWRRIDVLMGSPNPQGWMMETLKHVIQATRRSRDRARWAAQAAEEAGEVAATDEENLDTIYGDLVGQGAYELMKEYALEHQTVDELARARGLSREACKKQLQRARKKLKKYFEQQQE